MSDPANESWPPVLGVPLKGIPQAQIIAQIRKEFVEQVMTLDDDNLDVALTRKSRAHYLEKKHSVLTYYRLNPRTYRQLRNKGEVIWPLQPKGS